MSRDISNILVEDIEFIREELQDFMPKNFAETVNERMLELELNQSSLAKRTGLSHAAIRKYLNVGAKPHGKEGIKILGMALGMNESELNMFLRENSYPGLYAKNPLDLACRDVLREVYGTEKNGAKESIEERNISAENAVQKYNEYLCNHKLDSFVLAGKPEDVSTSALSQVFDNITSTVALDDWFEKNKERFRADDKTYIPPAELIRFVRLYVSYRRVNNLYTSGLLPVTIKNLLHPLLAGKTVAVKVLRAKLIVFGFFKEMNEREIDIMLNIAKFLPITEPVSRVDKALLTALRCAHDRYPYYELENAEMAISNLGEYESPDLYNFYEEQRRQAKDLAQNYDKYRSKYYLGDSSKTHADAGEPYIFSESDGSEWLFEHYYTSQGGNYLVDYMRDILTGLVEHNVLSQKEADEYLPLMRVYNIEDARTIKHIFTVQKGVLTGKLFELAYEGCHTKITLGRQDDCDIVLTDDTVSGHHCEINITPPTVTVRDLGSRNGTYLNGKLMDARCYGLNEETRIKLGSEFFLQPGDRLGLSKNCELVMDVVKPQEKVMKPICNVEPVCDELSGNHCEGCGKPLFKNGKASMCEVCQNDAEKVLNSLIEQIIKKTDTTAVVEGFSRVKWLGSGGMGHVWLIKEVETGHLKALKLMQTRSVDGESETNLFLREAHYACQLDHENIVQHYIRGKSSDVYYILSEYSELGNLDYYIHKNGGKLSVEPATNIILQVLEGLIYAHGVSVDAKLKTGTIPAMGIVHRDIKPSNILLFGSDDAPVAKITDFGLAKAFDTASLSGYTIAGEGKPKPRKGTPEFMPRQQVEDYLYTKPAVDVWAAAACFYYMLTGMHPKDFQEGKNRFDSVLREKAVPIRERNADIPEKLSSVIDKALVDDPEIGVQSAVELKTMIEGAL